MGSAAPVFAAWPTAGRGRWLAALGGRATAPSLCSGSCVPLSAAAGAFLKVLRPRAATRRPLAAVGGPLLGQGHPRGVAARRCGRRAATPRATPSLENACLLCFACFSVGRASAARAGAWSEEIVSGSAHTGRSDEAGAQRIPRRGCGGGGAAGLWLVALQQRGVQVAPLLWRARWQAPGAAWPRAGAGAPRRCWSSCTPASLRAAGRSARAGESRCGCASRGHASGVPLRGAMEC